MSRVYFHSPHGRAELHGSERHWLGYLCQRIAEGLFNLDGVDTRERLTELLHPDRPLNTQSGGGDPVRDGALWQQRMRGRLYGMFDPMFVWKGTPIDAFTVVLNTALAVGNDTIRLAARIHGQCELHAYVEGPNRAWLADMMETGLDQGLYRRQHPTSPELGQGWEEVAALLRTRDDEPVVMSYSVCGWFPNPGVAGWDPEVPDDWRPEFVDADDWAMWTENAKEAAREEAPGELWGALPETEQWERAMAGLRHRSETYELELNPDGWSTFVFQHGLTALDLLAPDYAERLDRSLA